MDQKHNRTKKKQIFMKPSIPKGTRDFLPQQVVKRNYIFQTIKDVFVKYGYMPIETPTMEKLETLTGKYGEEGDKLLFKILNSGDFLSKADKTALAEHQSTKLIPSIAEKGLRYDLTVPFARFVVMHRNDIAFPFKRYQIQPVWRADRPQKGRYREFYQCDVDVVGSDSLMYEAELVQMYDEVFAKLGIQTIIHVNNRKVLFGMAEAAGIADQFMDMTIAIDKLDKIGLEGVRKEMEAKEIPLSAIEKIEEMLQMTTLEAFETAFSNSETGLKGIEELRQFHQYFDLKEPTNQVRFSPTLARGLNYYTGCIFEVAVDTAAQGQEAVKMGSIGGGGRYDDLTAVFGLKDVSGVGVSFGAARIYDVLEELNLFPENLQNQLQVLFLAGDAKSHLQAFEWIGQVRDAGINAALHPEYKYKKQMKYTMAIDVPYTIMVEQDETGHFTAELRNVAEKTREKMTISDIIGRLR